jgi:hypothetical protein
MTLYAEIAGEFYIPAPSMSGTPTALWAGIMTSRHLLFALAASVVALAGCSSSGLVSGPDTKGSDPSPAPSQNPPHGKTPPTAPPSGGTTASVCCPRDATQSGCMNLGGSSAGGQCYKTCDFWCSTNWRVEKDDNGCEVWNYDYAPSQSGDPYCGAGPALPDAGRDTGPTEPDSGATCCPRSASVSGCMDLGGASQDGCGTTCEFWCSTNWRVETDALGCEVWRYDTRAPHPEENVQCETEPDAG